MGHLARLSVLRRGATSERRGALLHRCVPARAVPVVALRAPLRQVAELSTSYLRLRNEHESLVGLVLSADAARLKSLLAVVEARCSAEPLLSAPVEGPRSTSTSASTSSSGMLGT